MGQLFSCLSPQISMYISLSTFLIITNSFCDFLYTYSAVNKTTWISHRSSHQRFSVRKRVLGNYAKFTGKLLCLTQPVTLLKKRLWYRCFPVNFENILKILFLQNTSGGCFFADFYVGQLFSYLLSQISMCIIFFTFFVSLSILTRNSTKQFG